MIEDSINSMVEKLDSNENPAANSDRPNVHDIAVGFDKNALLSHFK